MYYISYVSEHLLFIMDCGQSFTKKKDANASIKIPKMNILLNC